MSTHVMMTKNSSLLKKVRHDVKKFVMMSRCLSWSQKVCHEVNNTSWREKSKICQNFVMKSTTFHDVTKFAMTSKGSSWCQKHVMMTKSSSLLQKNHHETSWRQKFVKKTKICHEVKNISWSHKMRYDVKKKSWLQ